MTSTVPVIDASRLSEAASLRAIDEACREWGFFQVVRHGVPPTATRALQREMRSFFALPLHVKRGVERSEENPWGFYDRELTKNVRDRKQIFDCGPEGDPAGPTPWPAAAPGLRPALRAFASGCERLAFRLLAALSVNLGLSPDRLARDFRPRNGSFLRLNYYPVHPACASGFGVNRHTDSGALTLLLQDDEPGLEVCRDGAWHGIEPRPDALVVNIGDVVQVWSNDRYRAALHRVRASRERPRFSAPFFFNPAAEACYAPLPTTVGPDSPARYRPIRWSEFRALRAAGDYHDCGEEIQIHHYRLPAAAGSTREEIRDDLH